MRESIQINDITLQVFSYNTLVVGSGAASLNAADTLYKLGQKDIALITEGMNQGTSRNTGSDKQTYYKQSTTIGDEDSPLKMARTLFAGGGMHGDIALVEAALSLKSFYHLVHIGVPFPHDSYGQYVGYKTDHDQNSRASSVGPLTSKYMTEKLEEQVRKNGTDIFDSYLVIGILKDKQEDKAIGVLALDMKRMDEENYGLTLFNATNVIYGTGGPASTYHRSVYPKSQSGATGIALEAGVKGHNLTEWQYGIASIKFRWNLSGTYQQVIPRYYSVNEDLEDERDFLEAYFNEPTDLLNAIFLKGYQWPFDPRKLNNNGSSMIDLLIYIETQIKGRRVFMDFRDNPKCADEEGKLNFDLLGKEAYEYLVKSGAKLDTPIQRLKKMNPLAIDLYKNHHIDLENEPLEVDVCAQHQNGGLVGNHWWESNIKHFFPVGEVNGTLGVYRPGGTALNSTQVGSYRAAEYVSKIYTEEPLSLDVFKEKVKEQVEKKVAFIEAIKINDERSNLQEIKIACQRIMSKHGAFIREREGVLASLRTLKNQFSNLPTTVEIKDIRELPKVFRVYDMLIAQIGLLTAIDAYIEAEGNSRGSYLIHQEAGEEVFNYQGVQLNYTLDKTVANQVCEVELSTENKEVQVLCTWQPVRPIPAYESWFETVWQQFRENKIYLWGNYNENKSNETSHF